MRKLEIFVVALLACVLLSTGLQAGEKKYKKKNNTTLEINTTQVSYLSKDEIEGTIDSLKTRLKEFEDMLKVLD